MNFLLTNSARAWGGNEKWTLLTAKYLSHSHKVIFAYRDPLIGDRFPVRKHRFGFVSDLDLHTVYRLSRLVREEEIDVIIPTKRKDFALAGMVSRLTGCTNILRLGIERDLNHKFLNNLIYNRWADGIIVNAQAIKATLLRSSRIAPEKIGVILNGLDTTDLDASAASEPKLDERYTFIVASMGRITRVKRVDILVEAFSGFIRQTGARDALLLIIGDGETLPEIREQIRNADLTSCCMLTGYLDNPYPYLSRSDVFVSMSMREGISNALLEAMYFRCLVITTPAGGAGDVVCAGENGYIIDFNDIAALTEHLVRLYRNPQLMKSMTDQARSTVQDGFKTDRMIEEIVRFTRHIRATKNRYFV